MITGQAPRCVGGQAADLIVKGMDAATLLKCSEFGDAVIKHMGQAQGKRHQAPGVSHRFTAGAGACSGSARLAPTCWANHYWPTQCGTVISFDSRTGSEPML